ncbi:hypothetical protein GOBAR_AA04569 [Gossypium barbadense]|uniref:RNase H type-1 domain-containing protein n=1 Tax=Gossypium barbadense TaxID=3634 RepID=A0A2P5YK33_GOSBA|nr:hypothetical protein GOBAR_AA04569 [Gossypium barbadense]
MQAVSLEWFGINLSNPNYFVCNPNDWPTLFGATCRHLWIRRNNSVFNADFIEGISILEKSYRTRDEYFHLNKDLASSIGQRQTKACKLIRWNPPEDEWHKVKTDGAVCGVSGNASAGEVFRDKHGKWTSGFSKYISCCSALNAELWGINDIFKASGQVCLSATPRMKSFKGYMMIDLE